VRGCSGTCDAASVQKSLQGSLFCDSHICFWSDSPNENLSDTSSLLSRRWLGSSTRGRGVLLHHMPETRVGAHDIYGNGGKAAVAAYPTQSGQTACLKARTQTHRALGTQHPIPLRAESYLIRDVRGYPDLALKGKITFGVSAAQEYKIDIDGTHAA